MINIVFLLILLLPLTAGAHPGGQDSQGGHHNKEDSTYHCHKPHCKIKEGRDNTVEEAISENRAFTSLYKREAWKHWSDLDGDCMNTRHEALLEQADGPVKLSPDGCYVSTGTWNDPFSGKGFTRASQLDVDHIVPLKWAHGHGGDR